jgi:5S rRNA maturation endonuclease (ribonuclease M5)
LIHRILSSLACGRGNCPCSASVARGRGLTHCVSHDDPTPSLNIDPAKTGDTVLVTCHGGCTNADVIAELKARDLWPKAIVNIGVPFSAPVEVARYPYQKADGSHAYDIIRLEPKTFRASRTVPEAERVLYHLPEVLAAGKQTVHVCEGEKDADALRSIGAIATCNPFGAGKFLERYAEPLIGANVVVWADKDDTGRAHAKDVAQKLSVAARSVKIIESSVGKDAADAVAAGLTSMLLESIVDDLPEWTSGEKVIWTAKDLATEYRETIAKRIAGDPDYVGWRTGYPSIDENLRYRAGEVWMVVAATSVGKSALMQSLQRRASVPSVYFSLEMSRTQLVDRLIAAEANVDAWNLSVGNLSADEKSRVNEAIDRFQGTDMQIVDNASMSTAAIESVLRVARVRFNLRLCFLDYIGLINDRDGESRYVQMSNVSHAIKRIAMSTGVCMVVGSQVNRKGDRKSGEPPFLDEIRDSGVVGEDADVILALGRAEGSTEAKLAVRKARNALAGYPIPLTFDAMHATFLEPREASLKKAETRLDAREADNLEIPI